jgi:hypothetical protein
VTITQDLTRVMHRIKALYRSWAIPCSGTTLPPSEINPQNRWKYLVLAALLWGALFSPLVATMIGAFAACALLFGQANFLVLAVIRAGPQDSS